MITKIIAFFTGTNQRTWLGHAVQGLLLGFVLAFISPAVAAAFVIGAFWHRELSDFVEPVYREELTWTQSWAKVREDGAADFFAPIVGGNLGIIIQGLLL